ncbi:unnamed protein product [Rotaria magnacalcarata]|uniref:Uncharacterized protein n=1 Tax=Rotaria magnacalcarata TaxID=392030 RepID=A0A8S3EUY1_9BILA|nr:unnamed protein product [Rotaria magnacalcarata]
MATYGDTLNQTFPRLSSIGDDELHRTFHTSSSNTKTTGFNFEQQFMFDYEILTSYSREFQLLFAKEFNCSDFIHRELLYVQGIGMYGHPHPKESALCPID